MAVRERSSDSLSGGIARWVSPEEVRQIIREVAALDTTAQLSSWGADSCWRSSMPFRLPVAQSGLYGGLDRPLTDDEREQAVAMTLASVAGRRRDEAVRDRLRQRRQYPPWSGSHGLIRCPSCERELDDGVSGWRFRDDLYCASCGSEQDTEIADLVAAATVPA